MKPLDKSYVQLYLNPDKLAELAYNEPETFIKLMKQYKVKNLVPFVGFEAEPPLVLHSGRQVSTKKWNPLLFALVQGKTDLFNFIIRDLKFNIKALMELPLEDKDGD